MKAISSLKIIALNLCIAFFFASCVHAGVVSGREPTSGVNVLNLDNSEGEFDAVAVLVEEGWPNPVCSIFIPAGGSYTLNKVPTGSLWNLLPAWGRMEQQEKSFTNLEKMGKIAQPIIMDTSYANWEDASYDGLWVNWETDYTIYTFTLYEVLGGDIPRGRYWSGWFQNFERMSDIYFIFNFPFLWLSTE